MSQSWHAVNLDRREYFGALETEPEQPEGRAAYAYATGAALMLLGVNPRWPGAHPLVGTWAGHRVVMLGDYARSDQGGYLDQDVLSLQEQGFTDITDGVFRLLAHTAGVARPEER
jgi:hypothetical protein